MLNFTLKVLRESLKDKQVLAYVFIVPSIAMLLIGFVITTMGTADVVKLGIVNDDQGMLNKSASAAIIQGLQGQDNLTLVYLTGDQLDDAFKNKEIDGAVVFGGTFTADLMTKKNASLRVVAEGTDQAKGTAISSALTAAATKATAQLQQAPAVPTAQQIPATQSQPAPAAQAQQASGSPIKVVAERYYGNGLGVKEFALASIIGLISFVLPCLLTITAIFGRKGRDSRDPKAPGPLGRAIVYVCTFGLLGIVQVLTVMAYAIWYIKVTFVGEASTVALVQVLIAVSGVSIGILIAALARDFQQAFTLFIPAIVLQMLFGGLMVPISRFPAWVQYFSDILPYTYASDSVKNILIRGFTLGDVWVDCTALVVIALAAFALAYVGLRVGQKKAMLVTAEQQSA